MVYLGSLIKDGWITPYPIRFGSPYPLNLQTEEQRQRTLAMKKELEEKVRRGEMIRHLFTCVYTEYSVRRNCKMVLYRPKDSTSNIKCVGCGKHVLESSRWFFLDGKYWCGACHDNYWRG